MLQVVSLCPSSPASKQHPCQHWPPPSTSLPPSPNKTPRPTRSANMDYVVDDVVRRVSSSSRRSRGGGEGSRAVVMSEPAGRGVIGAGSGIPGVVEAVLRIGGSAMGPALVRYIRAFCCCRNDKKTARSLYPVPPLLVAEHPSFKNGSRGCVVFVAYG